MLLFECGKFGWDACQIPNGTVQPWINFDFGKPTVIDGFALWNGGDGQHDVREEGQKEMNIERAEVLGDHLRFQLFRRNTYSVLEQVSAFELMTSTSLGTLCN